VVARGGRASGPSLLEAVIQGCQGIANVSPIASKSLLDIGGRDRAVVIGQTLDDRGDQRW
jgi:hypothetical protein